MASRPNVLLIMADQFRWDAIAAHGDPSISTPNLDRLAGSGVSFRRAYTETPVCVPARAAALTGRLGWDTGVLDNSTALDTGIETFAKAVSRDGYHTQAIGKMHFAPPRQDYGLAEMRLSEEIPESLEADDFTRYLVENGLGHVREPHGVRHELYYLPQISQLPPDHHTTAWTGRETMEFIRHSAGAPDPWLCWTSFIKPHPPFDPPVGWYDRYDPLEMRGPRRVEAELATLERNVRLQHRFKWTSPHLPTLLVRTMRAYYYASVSFVDHWIGSILDELERTGQRENTLVMFTADHGEYLGDHWAFGKRGYHDAAARIPMIASWPGSLPANTEVQTLVGLANIYNTVMQVAGLPGDPGLPPSLLTLAEQPTPADQRWHGVFGRGDRSLFCAMDGHLKYVYSAGDDRETIFPMGQPSGDLTPLTQDDPRWARAMALGKELRETVRGTRLTGALDGDAWRGYGMRDADWSFDDASLAGRGRQYPVWDTGLDPC